MKQEQFVYVIKEGKVISTSKGQWTLQGVEKDFVKNLHPQLYEQIEKAVQAHYNIVELEEDFKAANRLNDFRNRVTTVIDTQVVPEGYTLEVVFPMSRDDFPSCTAYVKLKGVVSAKGIHTDFDISYDGSVCSAGDWHSHSTNKPWVKNFDYKNTRYGTLDKAIAAGILNLTDEIEKVDRHIKQEKELSDDVSVISKELGFKAVKDEYYRKSSSPYKQGTVEKVIAVKFAKGDYDGVDVHISRNKEGYIISRIKVKWSLSKIPAAKMIKLLAALQDITKEV